MKRHRYLWVLVGLLVLTSLACNAFAGEPTAVTLPRPDLAGSGTVDGDTGAGLPTAVIQNIAPTATLRGEPSATATPVVEPVTGEPLLKALVDVNIRVGPGVAYERDSFILKGETAVVLGRHAESGWWKIVCPERADGNVCWVSGGSEYTSVSNGAAAQAVVAPPTPTAAPTVAATAVVPTAVSDLSAASAVAAFGLAVESRMVYADAGALWLLTLGETAAADPIWLADAEDVNEILISPNGRYVAYLIVDEYEASLNLADIETGVVQSLVDAADLAEMVPAPELVVLIGQMQWLANSEAVAFNTYAVDRAGGPGVGGQEDLWTVDLAGSLTEQFPAGEGGGTFAIAPDNVVVFGQTTAVVRANLDGSQRQTVINFDFVNTASEFAFYPWLQWTEAGAFAAISSPDPYSSVTAALWRIPASGAAESLTTLAGNIIFSPVIWSDNGRQLGYIREVVGSEAALVIGSGDGVTTADYADSATHFFGWSPAARHFVYGEQGNYAVGQLGESPLVVDMAEGKTAVSAQWLNDDTFIISLGSADNWDFRLQTIDGPATRLISGSTTPLFDTWSP
ncbi:MAG: hypothetical protein IAF02_27360 [Anaerolineae bacterium]|nr:hypothetical protein [Anaerolineae bacterium]